MMSIQRNYLPKVPRVKTPRTKEAPCPEFSHFGSFPSPVVAFCNKTTKKSKYRGRLCLTTQIAGRESQGAVRQSKAAPGCARGTVISKISRKAFVRFRRRNEWNRFALFGLKNRRCVMKPMPDADENRRLAEIQKKKAEKLPAGPEREALLHSARSHESSAHSNDWRDSGLKAPN